MMPNKTPRWTKAIFVLCMTICCAFTGLFLSRFFIPKSAGLAGGVMVLSYGLGGLFIGLLLGFVLKNRIPKRVMYFVTGLLAAICFFALSWLTLRIRASNEKMAEQRAKSEEFYRTHKPTAQAVPIASQEKLTSDAIGLGMASPIISNLEALYFYRTADESLQSNPVDSVTFVKRDHGDLDIATAPPYLAPAHLKLDYQIFYFRVLSQTQNYMQVTVNEQTGQSSWVRKDAVKLASWPDFLLNVFSVEPQNWDDNPIRVKPMRHASPHANQSKDLILTPLKIQAEWMEVKLNDKYFNSLGSGWIRWRSNEELIVRYSLLS